MLITTAIIAAFSLILTFGTIFVFNKKTGSNAAAAVNAKVEEVREIISQIDALLAQSASYASKGQLDSLIAQIEEAKINLNKEKEILKEVEGKLDSVQKNVETKESQHQEMKSSREEEELKLAELLENFQTISQESINLEHRLADSLKNLDSMMAGVEMTEEQRAALEELSSVLTNAGTRMRDLLTEYNMVKERLDTLSTQHKDLEEEYTRLVEQQLGE